MRKSKFPPIFLTFAIVIFVILLFNYFIEKANLSVSNYRVWISGNNCYGSLFTITSNTNEVLNLSSLKIYLNGNEVEKFNLDIRNLGFCNPQQIVKGEIIEIFIENAGCSWYNASSQYNTIDVKDIITVNINNYSEKSVFGRNFLLVVIPYGCIECKSGVCNFENCDLENKCLKMRAAQENNPLLCEQIEDENCYISVDNNKRVCDKIEYCYKRIALKYKNLEYCDLMNRTEMKVDCYTIIATNLRDIEICDMINESWSKLIDVDLEVAACKEEVQRPVAY